jgi:hypothetical protein
MDSKESIPPAYIASQAGTTTFCTRFLAPIDCSKNSSTDCGPRTTTFRAKSVVVFLFDLVTSPPVQCLSYNIKKKIQDLQEMLVR